MVRIDIELVNKGIFESRSKAQNEIKNGIVFLNEQPLNEEYLDIGTITDAVEGCFTDVVVPDGHVYVLGDNREVSGDSRRFGCIPIDKIEGKAVFRFWPLNKIGFTNKK